ncbi:hypothetical protein [Stenotrophomonas sp. AB1(2024)]|uniref:hypothetical protein n=1 Tax=Stenotrophomonas sp. AB1(2024) TaxID=3132215 RepID=UPI00309C5264
MSITRTKQWMYGAAVTGALALAACSPPSQPATEKDDALEAVPVAAEPDVKSIEALTGLSIVRYGPTTTKALTASEAQDDRRVDVWVKADRDLEGYDAALWLGGKRLDNRAISGSTVTGSISASMLTAAGTLSLEIRIGEDGSTLSSSKVDFTIE